MPTKVFCKGGLQKMLHADASKHVFLGDTTDPYKTYLKHHSYTVHLLSEIWVLWTKHLGPVVQSVVSLTSSLRVFSLTVLAASICNILIFFADKMWVAFALQKLLTFFQQKNSEYLRITQCKF